MHALRTDPRSPGSLRSSAVFSERGGHKWTAKQVLEHVGLHCEQPGAAPAYSASSFAHIRHVQFCLQLEDVVGFMTERESCGTTVKDRERQEVEVVVVVLPPQHSWFQIRYPDLTELSDSCVLSVRDSFGRGTNVHFLKGR